METKKKWTEMTAREAAQALAARKLRPLRTHLPNEVARSYNAEYWKYVRRLTEEANRKWTYDEVFNRAKVRYIHLVGHEPTGRYAQLMDVFARYIAGEDCALPATKGIILSGCTGCGKTTLFRLYNFNVVYDCDNPKRPLTAQNSLLFESYTCNGIARGYADENTGGAASLRRYFAGNALFDDLGTENVAAHFGTKSDVMGEVLQARYDRRKSLTFITTNLTYGQIQQTYGERVASRLAEMCSWVDMGINEDYRR